MRHLLLVRERDPLRELASPPGADETVRHSQVWEDHEVLRRALLIRPGDDVLSLGGAGSNVLALLLEEPRSIVTVDANPAQTALLELKLIALQRLSHPEYAAFLGARPAEDREATYHRLRAGLSPEARSYWDEHPGEVYDGVLCSGALDRHVLAFVHEHVARLVDPAALAAFLDLSSPMRQRAAFAGVLGVLEQPAREWFGRSRLVGRTHDGWVFRNAGRADLGAMFWRRFVEIATMIPARSNFYLQWLLTGQYRSLPAGPPFLRPDNFARLRLLADRVRIVRSDLAAFVAEQPPEAFSAASVSDVLDYLPRDDAVALVDELASRLRPGGRFVSWTQFPAPPVSAGGGLPPSDGLRPLTRLSTELFGGDRIPWYTGLDVREARSPGPLSSV